MAVTKYFHKLRQARKTAWNNRHLPPGHPSRKESDANLNSAIARYGEKKGDSAARNEIRKELTRYKGGPGEHDHMEKPGRTGYQKQIRQANHHQRQVERLPEFHPDKHDHFVAGIDAIRGTSRGFRKRTANTLNRMRGSQQNPHARTTPLMAPRTVQRLKAHVAAKTQK